MQEQTECHKTTISQSLVPSDKVVFYDNLILDFYRFDLTD